MSLRVKVIGIMALLWGAMGGLAAQERPNLYHRAATVRVAADEPPAAPVPAAPVAKVTGKDKARQGELIVLSAEKSENARYSRWTVWADISGDPLQLTEDEQAFISDLRRKGVVVILPTDADDDDGISFETPDRLVLASFPGTYRVMLAVSNEHGLSVAKHTVVVVGNNPQPPPNEPDPPPPDNPPPPSTGGVENRYDLENASRLWLVQIPNETMVERPAMRKIWQTIGQGAKDGKYLSIEDIVKSLGSTLNDAHDNKHITKPAWNSWGKSANDTLKALVASGKITGPQDYGHAMLEIAEGIKVQ